ncbi:MAG: hypothetical protein Q9166_004968 [cf. Caloplaca sp. 2 TL-2023]
MDPLSLTVGIVALLDLTSKIIKVTKIYCHEARYAKEAAGELLAELDILHFNLSHLDKLLKTDAKDDFSNTSVLVTSTHACRIKLNTMYDKLNKAADHPLHRFRWPLNSEEHRKTLQDLRAFAQWIQFALTIDGSTLLAKTSSEIIDVLTSQLRMFQLIDEVDLDAQAMRDAVFDMRNTVLSSATAQERETILAWLSNANPSQKHHEIRLPRTEGTGNWLLDEPTFKRWRDGSSIEENVLWCHGIQGSGKSILASLVIDHLNHDYRKDGIAIAHHYFDYRDQDNRSLEETIANLVKQIASTLPELPAAVAGLYHRFSKQHRTPKQHDLVQVLSSVCHELDRVYIIIDALDECDRKHRVGFLKALEDLKGCAKVFVTSRPYLKDSGFQTTLQIEIKAHTADLRKYIDHQIELSDISDDFADVFRNGVVDKVIRSAQEMFLLAVLHVQTILNEPTVGEMEEAVDRLPQTLHATFNETIQRIKRQPEGRSRLALQCLMWISHVKRPLTFTELSDALAIRPGLASVSPRYRPSRKTVLDSCHGLITIDEESQIIRLVHYSVHAFLLDGQEQTFVEGEKLIAELCIAYQMMGPFTSGCCQNEDEIVDRLADCPFIEYAARYWGFHVLAADSSSTNERTFEFLRARPQQACSYQIWQYANWESKEAVSCNGLHMASMFGLYNIAVKLIPLYPIDAATHMGTTALMKAASCGHRELVSLFMNMHADPTKHNWYGTILHGAAEAGEVDCIHELLDRGVDVNIEDDHGRVALSCAAESGHIQAMCTLLERGADVNFFYRGKRTPLLAAVKHAEPPDVIQTLLRYHADPNIPSVYGSTALHMAARNGDHQEEVARMLLDYGADVNAPGERGHTPLDIAAAANSIVIMQLFLDRGAAIDAQSDYGYTALDIAAHLGNVDAVRLLVEKGANRETADELGNTPLHLAEKYGHTAVVRLLRKEGAEKRADNKVRDISK